MSESKKCAHPACSCVSTEKYCSEKCADSKNLTELPANAAIPVAGAAK